MIREAIPVDDQPMSANFFGAGTWLTDYITPDSPDIQILYKEITRNLNGIEEKSIACWDWVANEVKYQPFLRATVNIAGKVAFQEDYWQMPNLCSRTKIGNCANKAFLLTSLLRNHFEANQVYCVFGNLHNGHETGHAWVEAIVNGTDFILESTRNDVPMVPTAEAPRYEPIHYFNDKTVLVIPGRTEMVPFAACYSDWLRDYLNWRYIEERNQGV